MSELMTETPRGGTALTAGDVMRREVLTVDAGTSVRDVWQAMQSCHVQHAVVLLQGTCVGVVALTEMWVAWSLELAPVANRSVLPLVTPTPCVAADTGLPQLCQVLLRSRYGAAMVLDEDGELLGLVTADDVLDHLAAEDVPC